MRRNAFDTEFEDRNFEISFNLNPQRWIDNCPDCNTPILCEDNWQSEIKYLNSTNDGISDEIKEIPSDTGGIQLFFIKGITLPFFERHIVYIGRCHLSDSQNINKRAKEYFTDKRPKIKNMFKRWGQYIYYRYYPDTNNDMIDKNEVMLIRAIKPDFNEEIPDKLDYQPVTKAF